MNEMTLIICTAIFFLSVLVFYRFFGLVGLFGWTVFATITANIEVVVLVKAFGLEQTLGNILFATTFLCTDIASEMYGKKAANHIVNIGIVTSLLFIVLTQSWMYYVPSTNDFNYVHLKSLFQSTPRILLAGLVTYAICQKLDVWLYHSWWGLTAKKSHSKRRFLWFRNNVSTMMAQLANTVLFTLGAFYGTYEWPVLIDIMITTYIIYFVLALCDTGILYWARRLKDIGKVNELMDYKEQ
ncbi:queuosine precursor transporter [Guggenheimella bovis]